MKKLALLGMGVCILFALSSCKSKESAYKKAYEKAKQQELAEPQSQTPVEAVTPVAPAPAEVKVVESAPVDVRQEKVTVVGSNNGLLDYSVVCGSFSVQANAENLKGFLVREGYQAMVVFNAEKAMYRVVMGTYPDRASATEARDAFKAKYPSRSDFQGSWLLYRIQ